MEKGTLSNPYTYAEYQTKISNGTWHGGYVKTSAGTYYYTSDGALYNSEEDAIGCGCVGGDGSGLGSGSGSGSGCGYIGGSGSIGSYSGGALQAGGATIREGLPIGKWITLSWGSGMFSALSLPSISATLHTEANNGETLDVKLVAYWLTDYHAIISGFPEISYIIPSQYRENKA